MQPHEVKKRIEEGIPSAICHVNEFSGGSDHYSVVVVSSTFEGKTSLSRHRLIMDLFKEEVASGEVHALTIKAFTETQWVQENHPSRK